LQLAQTAFAQRVMKHTTHWKYYYVHWNCSQQKWHCSINKDLCHVSCRCM